MAVGDVQASVKETAQNFNQVLFELSGVVKQEREAQTRQTREFNKTIADVHDLVIHTDQSLNGKVLPEATALFKESEAWLEVTAGESEKLTTAANSALDAATSSLDTLNGQISNPDIREMIGHFDESSLHLSLMTAHGDDVMSHADHVADYYDKRLTTPQGFLKTVGIGLFDFAYKGAGIATALK